MISRKLIYRGVPIFLIGFTLGILRSPEKISAKLLNLRFPNICPQFTCKEVSAYWPPNNELAYLFTDLSLDKAETNARKNIFAGTSSGTLPFQAPNTDVLILWSSMDACKANCGVDTSGTWVAMQEVSLPPNVVTTDIDEINPSPCTPFNSANGGTNTINPPVNYNISGNGFGAPPG